MNSGLVFVTLISERRTGPSAFAAAYRGESPEARSAMPIANTGIIAVESLGNISARRFVVSICFSVLPDPDGPDLGFFFLCSAKRKPAGDVTCDLSRYGIRKSALQAAVHKTSLEVDRPRIPTARIQYLLLKT